MRIVAGEFRGRTITPPASFKARPTTDFAKENLFNILANRYDFDQVSLLDLFSGTGSISYEAVSRGAQKAVAVELYAPHAAFIRSMADKLGVADRLQCVGSNVWVYLNSPSAAAAGPFDMVFADPPYDMEGVERLPDEVLNRGLLAPDGVLVVEHSAAYDFSGHARFEQLRKYGSVHFSFFV